MDLIGYFAFCWLLAPTSLYSQISEPVPGTAPPEELSVEIENWVTIPASNGSNPLLGFSSPRTIPTQKKAPEIGAFIALMAESTEERSDDI